MAILIPAIGSCVSRMTPGERRLAVICRHYGEMDEGAQALSRWQLPHQVRKGSGSFNPNDDSIKVLTMHASKGLEFPVVALMCVGQMPAAGEDE